ncbi:enoyl-CoA hydratase/isomerase family protein [Bradyrhizobium embrapense]|uniref:enoyl-CoA hydratase/isomerase family protein n=1 Tax=Bradyrhizobium embrapense TaxID=630921 RepID=UPI003D31EFE4
MRPFRVMQMNFNNGARGRESMSEEGHLPNVEVRERTVIVTLDRPLRANRLESDDVMALYSLWSGLASDRSVNAIVLTARGKHFSSGFDLNEVVDEVDPTTSVAAFPKMIDALENLPQVTICALNGGVYGGATDLALACDFRFGVPSCEMFIPAARLGVQYFSGGLRRYVSRVGLNNAKRLLLLAEKFDADEMLSIGYLDRVVPSEQLMALALATAQQVDALAPLAVTGMKLALNAFAAGNVDEGAARAQEAAVFQSMDFKEGVAAWRQKRKPVFKGC